MFHRDACLVCVSYRAGPSKIAGGSLDWPAEPTRRRFVYRVTHLAEQTDDKEMMENMLEDPKNWRQESK